MLSPGIGRQGLGLPPRSQILKKAPHPSWNLQGRCGKFPKGPSVSELSLLSLPRLPGSPGHRSAAPSSTDSCSLASSLQEGTSHFIY